MLGHNETQLDSYNKNIPKAHGTLIANWYEERVHRDNRGEARALAKSHQPKKHQDLLLTDTMPLPRPEDDTKYRIIGDTAYSIPRPQNYHYGKGTSKADNLPKTGKKYQLVEQLYLKQVQQSIDEQQKKRQEQARKGHFQTTNKTTFTEKPLDQNRIGRLIMYDQNGAVVPPENVDEDLKESLGFKDRGQISSDEELKKLIDNSVGYERQEPVTFWRQKMDQKTFYMSKQGGQPFGKNNEFLKTFQHYKHYKD